MRNAIEIADTVDRWLRTVEGRLEEIRDSLTAASHALTASRRALRELADHAPPGVDRDTLRSLENRIAGLGRLIEQNEPAVHDARVWVARARGNSSRCCTRVWNPAPGPGPR